MDNRPIGFFDSGLGGLTSIPPMMKKLPNEKIIYFGDTARTPYGSKAVSTIRSFSKQIADFLVKQNVKMIVIACNTVSSTCLDDLSAMYPDIPIVGIIEPAADKVVRSCSEDSQVGIIGTKVTISTHAYKTMIEARDPDINVFETACPAFVPLIEEGIIASDIMDLTIHHYMDDFVMENRIDTMVLGCTHYPLIRSNIERIYPDIKLINPSEEIVSSIDSILTERDMHSGESVIKNVFYASDLSENFINMIDAIMKGSGVDANVKFINLEINQV
jgi:glutamate racemase